jgi:quercetin 2,3-dioxygenase
MITLRKSSERGHFDHGWLKTYHTFSFADYYDPQHVHFRSLRVINEDTVQPGGGFPTHPHRDMEIITYVLAGALEHRDSMGNGSIIRPGEIQKMSAGTGIFHSEFNPSDSEPVHLLQIWILPDQKGLTPAYEQIQFDRAAVHGTLHLIGAPGGGNGKVSIHQDVRLLAGFPKSNQTLEYALDKNRHAWLQLVRGELSLNGQALRAGDGAAISEETKLSFAASTDSEFLLFDLS